MGKLPDVGKGFMELVENTVKFITDNWVLIIIVGIAIMILSSMVMIKGVLGI